MISGFGGFGATPAPAFGSGGSTNAFGATPSMAFGGSTASGNTSTAEAAAKQGLFQFGSVSTRRLYKHIILATVLGWPYCIHSFFTVNSPQASAVIVTTLYCR